jgi:hypothetical protein
MMTDLSMLVNEQSSLLENIEYNIEETRRTTVEATGELRQAAKSQAKTRKLIMWCVEFSEIQISRVLGTTAFRRRSVLGVVTAGAVATVVGVVLSPLRTATKVASTVVAS